ncbi:type I restriction-modification system methyltransferase subunit [Staphylococcus aureus]|nr:type I restriction-modification system methyltransferase subunit [Staphylococcus aureus]
MSITEKQRQQQAELHKKLWSIANDLRGNMDASEFRNYILGLIFYRFLSEKAKKHEIDLSEKLSFERMFDVMDSKQIKNIEVNLN